MRVLLLEDEDAIRFALTRGLRQHGHQVEAAANLAEARVAAGRLHPEALVSDLKLPDGNGIDLAGELGLPSVLMTGYGTFDDAVRAMRLGCIDFFTKPVPIREVARALERIATRPQAGPTAIDADGEVIVAEGGSVRHVHARAVAWNDTADVSGRVDLLATLLPTSTQRLVAAELVQAAPAGRLVINRDAGRWCAWLRAPVDWAKQDDRRRLVACVAARVAWSPTGALVECPPAVITSTVTGVTAPAGVLRLWPEALAESGQLDLSGVDGVGSWLAQALRDRPRLEIIGASPTLRPQLEALGVEPHRLRGETPRPGVTANERNMLFGDT